jgi:hypothetical protein
VRPFLILVAIVVSGSAQAQFPYNYAPYTPRYPRNGNQYAPPSQSRSPASMAQAMLDAHNAIRARVGVPPLVWSDQLAQVAQDWPNHLIATGALSHRPSNSYGENIYAISGATRRRPRLSISGPRKHEDTTFVTIPAPASADNYTQIVWGKTRAVGCAFARNPQREVWVCNYDPPGNVIGFRPY